MKEKKKHWSVENYWRSNMQFVPFDSRMMFEKPGVQRQCWLFNKLFFWSVKRDNNCYLTCVIPLWLLTGLLFGLLMDQMFTDEWYGSLAKRTIIFKFFQHCTVPSAWIQFHVGLQSIFVAGTRSLLTWILSKLSFILLLLPQLDFFFSLHWWNCIITQQHISRHIYQDGAE